MALGLLRDALADLGDHQVREPHQDCLLVSASWATDGIVASNDNQARALLGRLTSSTPQIARIVWVNPTDPDETPVAWLEAGARSETRRRLGASVRRE